MNRHLVPSLTLLLSIIASAEVGAGKFPGRDDIIPPEPILDNSGAYFAPYTQDDTIAEWVDIGLKAAGMKEVGGAVGQEAGRAVGQGAGGGVGGLIGAIAGKESGKKAGRERAVTMAGGWEKIKETSDISFNSLEDLAAWLYATKSRRDDYQDVMALVRQIFPELVGEKWGDLIKAYYARQPKRP